MRSHRTTCDLQPTTCDMRRATDLRVRDIGELGLIERLARQLRTHGRSVDVGIGDDAAVLRWPGRGQRLVWTIDLLLDGVHFRFGEHAPEAIGWKALGCSVSDIAAMGARPLWALVSLGVPPTMPVRAVERLYRGMRRLADRFDVRIVGGDTDRSERLLVDVSVIGAAGNGGAVLRSGARIGDAIVVTGRLGNSYRSGRHLRFLPRVAEAQWLVRHVRPHAMMDVSDGLSLDLTRMTTASGVGAMIDAAAVPMASSATLDQALYEGEDFELLFAVAPSAVRRLSGLRRLVPVSVIGCVTSARDGVTIRQADGRVVPLRAKGFQHF